MYHYFLFCFLVVLNFSAYSVDGGGGGKGSKHDILKIHVPEFIKHNHHTHYVYKHIHHHVPKKGPKEVKHHHHHKHTHHVPGHHHHKHWVHKSHHGHKHVSTHGHGHKPVIHKHIGHKSHKTHKHGHGHGHKHVKPHKKHHHKKVHHSSPFTSDEAGIGPVVGHGYEVTENYDSDYDTADNFGANDHSDPGDADYLSYSHVTPAYGGGGGASLTSYDISPYHGTSNANHVISKTPTAANDAAAHQDEAGGYDDGPTNEDAYQGDYQFEYEPDTGKDFSFKNSGFGGHAASGITSDDFGENIPSYEHSHRQFLSDVDHTSYDDTKHSFHEDIGDGSDIDSFGFDNSFGHGKHYSSGY